MAKFLLYLERLSDNDREFKEIAAGVATYLKNHRDTTSGKFLQQHPLEGLVPESPRGPVFQIPITQLRLNDIFNSTLEANIHTLVQDLNPDPLLSYDIEKNNNLVRLFLAENNNHSLKEIKLLIPQVMTYLDEEIKKNPDQKEHFTKLKLVFAKGAIEATRGNWSLLPLPGEFGLMRGFSKRVDRVPVIGKDGTTKLKPKIPTLIGDVILSKLSFLGEGSFGVVKTATGENGKTYAQKQINLSSDGKVDYDLFLEVAQEGFYAQTLSVQCENILGIHDMCVFDDGKRNSTRDSSGKKTHTPSNPKSQNKSKCGILMDIGLGDGHTVMSDPRKSDQEKIDYVIGCAKGLAFLHSINLAHGDFKLANSILGTDGLAKLVDLGFVTTKTVWSNSHYDQHKVGGTHKPPEAQKAYSRNNFSPISTLDFTKVDVFAYGHALESMAKKIWPQSKRGNNCVLDSNDPQQVIIKKLIRDCQKTDPLERPTMTEVIDRLQRVRVSSKAEITEKGDFDYNIQAQKMVLTHGTQTFKHVIFDGDFSYIPELKRSVLSKGTRTFPDGTFEKVDLVFSLNSKGKRIAQGTCENSSGLIMKGTFIYNTVTAQIDFEPPAPSNTLTTPDKSKLDDIKASPNEDTLQEDGSMLTASTAYQKECKQLGLANYKKIFPNGDIEEGGFIQDPSSKELVLIYGKKTSGKRTLEGNFILSAHPGKPVLTGSGKMSLRNDFAIEGNFSYFSTTDKDNLKIMGQITYKGVPVETSEYEYNILTNQLKRGHEVLFTDSTLTLQDGSILQDSTSFERECTLRKLVNLKRISPNRFVETGGFAYNPERDRLELIYGKTISPEGYIEEDTFTYSEDYGRMMLTKGKKIALDRTITEVSFDIPFKDNRREEV